MPRSEYPSSMRLYLWLNQLQSTAVLFQFCNCHSLLHCCIDFKFLQYWIAAALHFVWGMGCQEVFFFQCSSPIYQGPCMPVPQRGCSIYILPSCRLLLLTPRCETHVGENRVLRFSVLAFILARSHAPGPHYSSHFCGSQRCIPHPNSSDGRPLLCVSQCRTLVLS